MATVKKTYPFYFGGTASCVAAIVVHPFDLTKVRLQTTKGNLKLGMFSTMVKIAKNEGFFRLYAGLSASILRQATYSTVRFGVYEKLKDFITSTTHQKASLGQLLICSSIAGALGGACGNPGDVINVRMQNDGQLPYEQRRNYKHAIDGVIRITKEEGVSALFRGVGPNMNRAILMTSSQCVSYDMFKHILLKHTSMEDGVPIHLASSILAGLVATTVCSPVDVIKTRIMSATASADHSNSRMSSITIMKQMFKAEGISSFFKGWTPAFIRLGPQTIITFVVLERFKLYYDLLQDKKSNNNTSTTTTTTAVAAPQV